MSSQVAMKLHKAATQHSPVGAHPLPGMSPLWPAVSGKFVSKRAATATFQSLELTVVDSQVTGHACRVTGAQAVAVAGVDVWLIQAFTGVVPGLYWSTVVIVVWLQRRTCPGKLLTACGSWRCGSTFTSAWSWKQARVKSWSADGLCKQVLEARVAEMGIGELKHGNTKEKKNQ